MAAAGKELSREEINRRTAILRRFKELLKAQRSRFQTYLDVLDRQKDIIESGTADDLIRHVDLEEKIVADIFSIQKVINPLQDLYARTAANRLSPKTSSKDAEEVIDIKTALEGLKKEAVSRSDRNRRLLSRRMAELRSEIKTLRSSPYNRQKSPYSGSVAPSKVDIRG